jgi:hypothetical protein
MHRHAIALICSIGLIGASGSALGQTIGFDLSGGSTFTTGEVVDLTVVANGFSNGLSIGGLDLQFNSQVLNLQSVSINSAFDDNSTNGGFTAPVIDNVGGNVTGVDFAAVINTPPTGNAIDLATFQFIAEAPGTSSLALSNDSAFGTSFFDGAYNALTPGVDFQFTNSNVTVTSMVAGVPEPPIAWLLAGAMLIGLTARSVLRGRNSARA